MCVSTSRILQFGVKVHITTTWVDANLYHDFMTGRSVTGIVHVINQTMINFFSKKQNTVETSTCFLFSRERILCFSWDDTNKDISAPSVLPPLFLDDGGC